MVTTRDEAGRRRRLSNDAFGRLKQVEELNWDTSVYSTTNYSYNGRDQITTILQQNDRQRSFVYDGHGRMLSRTTPEQGITTYSYYADDTVQTVTDARGASSTFTYNSRGLATNINYGVPSGVEPTPNVAFDYDSAGNRLWMTDGFGRVDYSYNTLSQVTSETRTLTGVGAFTLSYSYNLAGQLTGITNPWNYTNSYSFDSVGRLAGLSSTYLGGSNYISSVQYRAFGGPKQINYGNNRALSINYDNRLRLTLWDVAGVLGSDYEYRWQNTFRPTFAHSRTDATLDRWFAYDHVGRLSVSRSGSEARAAYGEPFNGQYDGPYSHGYHYDVWGNIIAREGWGGWNASYSATFNSKNQMTVNPGWGTAMQYDAAGNMTFDGAQSFTYDATGAQVQAPSYGKWQGHDGDGLRVKDVQGSNTTYYLRSSVLGGKVVAEISPSGTWMRGFVYSGGQLVAIQSGGNYFVHQDPITKSQRITDTGGNVVEAIELDPFGGETNRSWGPQYQKHRYTTWERDWTGDESLFRRYHGWWSRFAHPDPYEGSYELTDPQSLNRYTYVQNDPVNFVDPSGLDPLRDAIGTARFLLQNPRCRSLFGNQNPISLLNRLVRQNRIRVGLTYPTQIIVGSVSGQFRGFTSFVPFPGGTAAISLDASRRKTGPFLNPHLYVNSAGFLNTGSGYETGYGLSGLSPAVAGGIGIIHELLHMADRIPDDMTSRGQSVLNTTLVRMLCEMKPLTTDTTLPNTQPIMLRPIGGGGPIGGGSDPIPVWSGGGDPFDAFRWLDLWMRMMRGRTTVTVIDLDEEYVD